jgi:hypothetical protein
LAGPADDGGPAFCVVWLYRDTPDAFERAARYALQNVGYGLEVVIVLTDTSARLLQVDRLAQMLKLAPIESALRELVAAGVRIELDMGAARRAGVVETLGSFPNLRVADDERVAELAAGARVSARY